MAEMSRTGYAQWGFFQHRRFAPADIDGALAGSLNREGGFIKFVILP
jgi:hypothetical protein